MKLLLQQAPRVNRLIRNFSYQDYLLKIAKAEKKRKYCKHNFDHGLTVARIAYAYLLEQDETCLEKEIIYVTALLHDIGRWVEYRTGEDHARASAALAQPLLEESGFNPEEIKTIIKAIAEHSKHSSENLSVLGRSLALADNWARDCRSCKAKDGCYKFTEEMEQIIF
ncbi:MAG: HD domain-containing protein [Desulfitobacteriaceae bacterium]|nr:HD domain-containing protein [Desulfitobacteriaceae bacterium]MDD4346065.1 HD domain-containing protein [Desulfitobacteriaceae bacterium]MDD4401333.1 HD domain-containing protein [Desulfitobacteriaceae bacterium]